jgi:hypothetical protein
MYTGHFPCLGPYRIVWVVDDTYIDILGTVGTGECLAERTMEEG